MKIGKLKEFDIFQLKEFIDCINKGIDNSYYKNHNASLSLGNFGDIALNCEERVELVSNRTISFKFYGDKRYIYDFYVEDIESIEHFYTNYESYEDTYTFTLKDGRRYRFEFQDTEAEILTNEREREDY